MNYLLKTDNRKIKNSQENCQDSTIKTPELCQLLCLTLSRYLVPGSKPKGLSLHS